LQGDQQTVQTQSAFGLLAEKAMHFGCLLKVSKSLLFLEDTKQQNIYV
jgi:hypothetical protein